MLLILAHPSIVTMPGNSPNIHREVYPEPFDIAQDNLRRSALTNVLASIVNQSCRNLDPKDDDLQILAHS